VVIGMALVLTFFTLNLFGVFELGNSLTTVGGDLTRKQGYAGSFFQGVLLTVIGTPCTGPVLAVVIVWMLTQPVFIGFLAFTLMGLGMAAPYVALAYSPKLIDKLPPPGNWMVTFKRASAFMIVLFIWVMLYVLNGLIPGEGVVQVVGALLLVCFAGWVLGTWAAPGRSARTAAAARICTVLLLILSGWIAYSYRSPVQTVTEELQQRIDNGDPIRWSDVTPEVAETLLAEGVPVHYRPYSPELVDQLRSEGHAVFVDFTADWCTICKINKLRALHRDEVMTAFAEKGVVTLRADWTARDPGISSVLEEYGRRGVPVYLLFDDTPGDKATLLPESLTPDTVIDALDNL
jgi:thiol:disulfide interchange protein DsbD